MPLAAVQDRRARGKFKVWRGQLAAKSKRQADYAWTVLARVLAVSLDRGTISVNVCEKSGRLYTPDRAEIIWTPDEITRFLNVASKPLQLAMLLALWTGQRQGDLLKLTWPNYDGKTIRRRQSKGKARVGIPVGSVLKTALDAQKRKGLLILNTVDGNPWTPDGFRSSWGKACDKAGITGVTFHDLRGTAVSRLALVGCTEAEIAAMTGHSLKDVAAILDAHYLHPRSGARSKRCHEARNGNKESQLSAQLGYDVLGGNGK